LGSRLPSWVWNTRYTRTISPRTIGIDNRVAARRGPLPMGDETTASGSLVAPCGRVPDAAGAAGAGPSATASGALAPATVVGDPTARSRWGWIDAVGVEAVGTEGVLTDGATGEGALTRGVVERVVGGRPSSGPEGPSDCVVDGREGSVVFGPSLGAVVVGTVGPELAHTSPTTAHSEGTTSWVSVSVVAVVSSGPLATVGSVVTIALGRPGVGIANAGPAATRSAEPRIVIAAP